MSFQQGLAGHFRVISADSPDLGSDLVIDGEVANREPGAKQYNKQEKRDVTHSPFFRPSTPRHLRPVRTPGGTTRLQRKKEEEEKKSTLVGAYANLVNAIVGAGIVGIPYAVKETGLVAGVFMIILCAFITDKSLRLLIETGKHVGVPSYETLAEAAFSTPGFIFISINMFIMSFGGMVSYLIIIKDTVPILFGVDPDNGPLKRAVLSVSSLAIILPLSMQRDVADLSKTSSISVAFDCLMVLIIALFSPVSESVKSSGGFAYVVSHSTLNPSTFFIGLGVLSFAFVCQDSSFIIAGSLERPTKSRWGTVTRTALGTCGALATLCGVSGFLAFQHDTVGNILNNFSDPGTERAANIARALLGSTMFFVYPLASYVARHVCIVLLFRGRRAHEGDDHTVLARRDRRIALTCALYVCALFPALLLDNLGKVLAVTGAIGGSCLSYIGPGSVYLGIHGGEFLLLVKKKWGNFSKFLWRFPRDSPGTISSENVALVSAAVGMPLEQHFEEASSEQNDQPWYPLDGLLQTILWYVLFMPFWCSIASLGQTMLRAHKEKEAMKSPRPQRLGKIIYRNQLEAGRNRGKEVQVQMTARGANGFESQDAAATDVFVTSEAQMEQSSSDPYLSRVVHSDHDIQKLLPPLSRQVPPTFYGATDKTQVGNRAISAAIAAKNKKVSSASLKSDDTDGAEEDPQDSCPKWSDFIVAIGFIVFGLIAAAAGLASISMS